MLSPDSQQLIEMYTCMLTIRRFEEKAGQLMSEGRLPGTVHLYAGEEAVAVGTCANLRRDDYIVSTHRGHGHLIAKGGDIRLMFAELFGKRTGYCKGKGGSMHIADLDLGILGAMGIVGSGLPIAVGAAFAARYRGTDAVSVCFFGDGASNQGTFHEALNLASVWRLPAVFVCENNLYGMFTRQDRHQAIANIADRAAGYGMPGAVADGMDVLAVYETVGQAVTRARAGEGPALLEFKTYRLLGHFQGDPAQYRPQEEVDSWRCRDPIECLAAKLVGDGVCTAQDLDGIHEKVAADIEAAVKFAEESPDPSPDELYEDVYAPEKEGEGA